MSANVDFTFLAIYVKIQKSILILLFLTYVTVCMSTGPIAFILCYKLN